MKYLAVAVGKIIILLSRLFKAGGGSSFPGVVALKIDPKLVLKISKRLKQGTVVITGTNGKTTSAKLLAEILKQKGMKVVHNRTGSNMMRGVASALIEQSTVFGRPRGNIGLFEIDEATMPEALLNLKPKVVLVTNLFRDQLDRYGELDKIASIIAKSIEPLQGSTVILNADDPLVASLSKAVGKKNKLRFFGLGDNKYISNSRASIDSRDCVKCGSELGFEKRYYGHLGIYRCPRCSFKRPEVNFLAKNVSLNGVKSSSFSLAGDSGSIHILLNLSGIYNIYNSLAAYSAARALGIDSETIRSALSSFSAAFGRMEKVDVDGKEVYIMLAKNPIGLTQIIETLSTDKDARNFMIILNDNFADGTDVSWIWDADVRPIKGCYNFIYTSGIRAADMTLRLKYEDFDTSKIITIANIEEAFNRALLNTRVNEDLYIITTYTGMLQLRNYLTSKGLVKGFWEEAA